MRVRVRVRVRDARVGSCGRRSFLGLGLGLGILLGLGLGLGLSVVSGGKVLVLLEARPPSLVHYLEVG